MTSDFRLSLLEATFFERPVRLRLPFRFGVVTLTEAPQVYVRSRIRLADGREGEGIAAELMVPKWFDKSPELSNEQNFDQLRRALRIARRFLLAAGTDVPFALSAAVEPHHRAACTADGLNGLVASFGLSLLDRSIIDALGRRTQMPVFDLVRRNHLGITSRTAPDLAGFDLAGFLAGRAPARSIFARHTVGMVDALTRDETVGRRLDDGLPESLEEVIAAYGHRYFKIKVSGDIGADLVRLVGIAAVLDRIREPYYVTLDGNEQFENIDAVVELWRRIGEDARLAKFRASTIVVEQPIGRSRALNEPVHKLAEMIALEVDESDSDIDVFPRARSLGYRGISTKSCKGFYRGLLNRARVAHWNAEEGHGRYFMSAEDLTTQGGVALQQDLALASLVGVTHLERNGHHYVDGMAGAPAAEQTAFLNAHPDLYGRAADGRVRVAIRGGALTIDSLAHVPGLAVGTIPDWQAMSPMKE